MLYAIKSETDVEKFGDESRSAINISKTLETNTG
jgi:hypothetical protein